MLFSRKPQQMSLHQMEERVRALQLETSTKSATAAARAAPSYPLPQPPSSLSPPTRPQPALPYTDEHFVSSLLQRFVPYVCNQGHPHLGVFMDFWGPIQASDSSGDEAAPQAPEARRHAPPMPMFAEQDGARQAHAASVPCRGPEPMIVPFYREIQKSEKARYPVPVFVKEPKYTARFMYERNAQDLWGDELRLAEMYTREDKTEWYDDLVWSLGKEVARLDRAIGNLPETTSARTRFDLEAWRYWREVEREEARPKLILTKAKNSYPHAKYWADLAMVHNTAAADTLIARLQNELPRLGNSDRDTYDRTVYELLIAIVRKRKKYFDPTNGAVDREARAAAEDKERLFAELLQRDGGPAKDWGLVEI